LGHKQPASLTFSLAFPLAQNTLFVKFDFLYVGQVGHKHDLAFSSLSGTELPKKSPKNILLELIFIGDYF
jgi:hypothetical protein